MINIVVGKYVLESLSFGMYSTPYDIIREYIQNATDAIDIAYDVGLLNKGEEKIVIDIAENSEYISIRDNGTGIPVAIAFNKLSDVGNSDKDYQKNRGFRGIGRLGGLGYAEELFFITSAKGERHRTVIKWDCVRLRQLLSPSNSEKEDIVSVIEEVISHKLEDEAPEDHYFEVLLKGIDMAFRKLYTSDKIEAYLADVVPVDFDGQRFPLSADLNEHFANKGYPLAVYNICHAHRKKPIYKPYTRSLGTGLQRRTQVTDYVKDIEFVYKDATDGKPLYIGWLAITDFSGQIKDERLQGIRLRKGNILVGDKDTFANFFPSEGAVANKMFAGEIHILHPDIIPNAKRDDFEPGPLYQELTGHLEEWAEILNRTYRRGTSKVTSAIRAIDKALTEQKNLETQVSAGAISSDTKRDKFIGDLDKINKSVLNAKKELDAALRKGVVDTEKAKIAAKKIKQAEEGEKAAIKISNQIVNADYATKSDLPTSYSRDERKVYQRIISVIDSFFVDDPVVANKLREAIKSELSVKKK